MANKTIYKWDAVVGGEQKTLRITGDGEIITFHIEDPSERDLSVPIGGGDVNDMIDHLDTYLTSPDSFLSAYEENLEDHEDDAEPEGDDGHGGIDG